GMHRVYNSAFMNMLRDEKNAEYRLVIKNTLEFDPQILKRYVNFMNNPDERTAVDQFGKSDKYFGVATLMATLPGLPMFGHGQVEGFSERYGMEYRRAYLDETPDSELVARHERELFPLLHRRQLFAEVDDFALYDFQAADGTVNEDVFAYSNRHGDKRTLVVYHNRFGDTRGWIKRAAVTGRSLADGLGLVADEARFLLLRDWRGGLEYLRRLRSIADEGLYLELGAYQCHAFVELREVVDTDGRWRRLADWLGGRGVPSLEEALREMELAPLHAALRSEDAAAALSEAAALLGRPAPSGNGRAPLARRLEDLVAAARPEWARGRWIYEWLLDRVWPDADLVALRLDAPADLLADDRFRRAIGVNQHDGVEWFDKQRFESAIESLDLSPSRRARLRSAAKRGGYRLAALQAAMAAPSRATRRRPSAKPASTSTRGTRSSKPDARPVSRRS
ncbi:MAG TPA: hypothetical protein VNW68_08790, partial [Candidatus Limnocylindria bacterium]|nr:hypothetical protein [Candidatus Limnocylindria bacterium]